MPKSIFRWKTYKSTWLLVSSCPAAMWDPVTLPVRRTTSCFLLAFVRIRWCSSTEFPPKIKSLARALWMIQFFQLPEWSTQSPRKRMALTVCRPSFVVDIKRMLTLARRTWQEKLCIKIWTSNFFDLKECVGTRSSDQPVTSNLTIWQICLSEWRNRVERTSFLWNDFKSREITKVWRPNPLTSKNYLSRNWDCRNSPN